MKVDVIQTSFSGGEFGPSLYGRTDIAQYANACEIVQNMLPRSYGPAISMPGTRYVATASDSTLRTRLIKFVFNRSDAYVIEMGDLYMRFYTNRGQVITPSGTEDLSAFGSNVKAHWKCNDNTNSTTVLDAQTTHNGSTSTITQSLSTTAIVSTGFQLNGIYHVSVTDHANFTRTAASQPMTIVGWAYYSNNGSTQAIVSKSGEYEFSINSSDQLSFIVSSGTADTKLLIHADGADGSTSFTDSSASGHTITANGNAQVDTDQKEFGTGSLLCDGTGDYLSIPDHADWDFGTGDFTIDFWVRFNTLNPTQPTMIDIGGTAAGVAITYTANQLYTYVAGSVITYSWTPVINNWYHVAYVRSSGTIYAFINGTQIGTTANSNDVQTSQGIRIGSHFGGLSDFDGWMDEIRIVKGSAVWTSNFSVPSEPHQTSASNTWQANDEITTGWHLFAVVFKGDGTASGHCKIYIDGVSKNLTFTPDTSFVRMSDTTSLFRIGATSAAGAKNWKNKVDNIAFIHSELTATQIASLYSTAAYQLTTVFTQNEVFDVHYVQLNDIIWLAHPSHPPQKLIRTSANEWAISNLSYIGGPFLDSNTDTSTTLFVSATQGTINITAATGKNVFTLSGSTLGHHNAYFSIGPLTAETNATTGLREVAYVKITNVINSYTATGTVIKNLNVDISTSTSTWAEGAWSAVRGYPARVTLHDFRLWFARTNYEPQKEWASKIFKYEDYALDTEADDDSLNLPLSSTESNEIQWLASANNLLAGTFGGVFVTSSGGDDVAITPDNAHVSEEVGYGSASIMPRRIGHFVYYLQRFAKKLREMFYFFDLNTYKAVDRTILAPHILGDGIMDMDVQQNPESIVYCVLTSGTLATMTREVDQEVTAWATHTTSGTYTSIAVIPSQSANYDEAWVIVERWVNGTQRKYIEYFENIEVPARQDKCLYLHSALSFDAYEATSTSAVTISLSASSGSVTLTSSSAYFINAHVNRKIRAINAAGTTVGEGTITATSSTTSITLSITTTFNALSYVGGLWGMSVRSVYRIDHLEAKTVGILADGLVDSLTRTVASGTVTLTTTAFVIHVGLSYDQIIQTLPKEAAAQRGTAQGKWQRFSDIAFKVNRSTQNFKYGPDSGNLDDINLAFTPTITTLYTGIIPTIGTLAMRGGYFRGAKIYIKNSNPLPLEILSIMGALDTNEK
jgi:hypothetical protein